MQSGLLRFRKGWYHMKYVKSFLYLLAVAVLAAVCALLAAGIIQTGMAYLGQAADVEISDDALYGVSGTLGIGTAGLLLWGLIHKKKDWHFVQKKEPFQLGKALWFAFLTTCICKVLYSGISSWLLSLLMPLEETAAAGTEESIRLQLCMGVILAPVAEELLFRKDLYSLFVQKCGRIAAAVLTTAAFAALHGYGLQGFLSCMLAGFIFTYLYDRTGCIWYSILAHALCNLESLIYNLLQQKQAVLFGKPVICSLNGYDTYHAFIVFPIAVFLCVVLIWKCKQYERTENIL